MDSISSGIKGGSFLWVLVTEDVSVRTVALDVDAGDDDDEGAMYCVRLSCSSLLEIPPSLELRPILLEGGGFASNPVAVK